MAWFSVLAWLAASGSVLGAARPNVILIMTDDQGWWDLSCHGNPVLKTPVMDSIAAEGVEFTRFYASPVCTPTRASLMTGRYYQRTGAIDTYMGRDTLNGDEVTLGQVFQSAGYRTGLIGKWHLGRYMRYHPNQRGFDTFFGFWQYGFINRYDDSDELWSNAKPVISVGYVTDVLTDAAIEFVKASRDRPFFLYVPYNAPHGPYLAPDELIKRYLDAGLPLRDARIDAMIASLDANIGRLLDTVDRQGLRDNTIVIFMTDNGGVSSHYKAGLRGGKATVYEGGVRVPFFVRWPGKVPAGAKVDVPAQHIDIFPTLCELIGAELPAGRKIDGKSIKTLIETGSGPAPHKYLYHQWNRVRPDPDQNWAVQDGRYKLAKGELFDLESDPGEKTDIAAQHPGKVRELREVFEAWFADVTAGQDYGRVPIEVGRADENPVEIDLTWGEPVGKKVKPTYRHYNRDTIEDWSDKDDAVRWKIDVVEPGDYEVVVSYGCRPGDEGATFAVTVGESSVECRVEPRAGREVFQDATVGTLTLSKGPATLEIKPTRIVGQELMALHKIWLRRLGADASSSG